MRLQPSEAEIQRAITDYLSAERIWWMRMNSGAFVLWTEGKRRFFRSGTTGMADILCTPPSFKSGRPFILWIEVKSHIGRQSQNQIDFQAEVEEHGHVYLLARGLEEVELWLMSH